MGLPGLSLFSKYKEIVFEPGRVTTLRSVRDPLEFE